MDLVVDDAWRPLLVALDIDGTVVPLESDTVSSAVVEAVRRAGEAGVHVVLATGRRVTGSLDIAEQLGLRRVPAVCSNGAVIVVPGSREVVHTETFDPTTAITLMQEALPDAIVAVERPDLGYLVSREFPPGEIRGPQVVASMAEILSEPALRLVVRWPGAQLEEFVAAVEGAGLHGVNYAIGYSAWLDVMPPGVSKASALEVLRVRLGVPEGRTAAFGDGLNDLEMLAWATYGVAMGGAVVEVQDVADEVTRTAHEDGVAAVLDRWFA
ncbi:MAG TPA: HAD family hydrolase [Candidatus Limnocylindria bacterium]|nr:HAD family hydrolase [Candidatus Limnocylindria bacterium]